MQLSPKDIGYFIGILVSILFSFLSYRAANRNIRLAEKNRKNGLREHLYKEKLTEAKLFLNQCSKISNTLRFENKTKKEEEHTDHMKELKFLMASLTNMELFFTKDLVKKAGTLVICLATMISEIRNTKGLTDEIWDKMEKDKDDLLLCLIKEFNIDELDEENKKLLTKNNNNIAYEITEKFIKSESTPQS